ncbi:MAG: right-handed parallel beta-helix repeat-containing protein [Pseudomonadota bacterium]
MTPIWRIFRGAALAGVCSVAWAGEPPIHCVDPLDEDCFVRIQDAIDAAGPGDVVEVRPHPNGSYRESLTIDKAGLVLRGSDPVSIEERPVETLAALDWTSERAACSTVRLDVCDTVDIPGACGFDADEALADLRTGIVVSAANVTVSRLTLRHGFTGIHALAGADGITIDGNCFVRNGAAIIIGQNDSDSEVPAVIVDGASVQLNRIFSVNGDGNDFAVDVFGNGAIVRGNLVANADGIRVQGGTSGASQFVANAVVGTEDNAGIRVRDGAGHLVQANYIRGVEDDGIRYADLSDSIIAGNLVEDIPDDDGSLRMDDTTGVIIEDNRFLGSSNPAIELDDVVDTLVRNNVVASVGGDSSEGCIELQGSSSTNTVTSNTVQLCKQGIALESFREDAAANVIRDNLVEFAIRAGIDVEEQLRVRIRDNVITGAALTGIRHRSDAVDSIITGNSVSGLLQDICNDGTISEFADNSFVTGGQEVACIDD